MSRGTHLAFWTNPFMLISALKDGLWMGGPTAREAIDLLLNSAQSQRRLLLCPLVFKSKVLQLLIAREA